MRKIHAFLLFVVLLSACNFMGRRVRGSGHVASELRTVGNFDGIRVRGSMDVVLTPGAAYSVKVEADDNLLKYILTEQDGNTLEIGTRNGYNLNARTGMKVYITAPALDEITVTGSGSVVSTGRLTANRRLKLDATGSGDIKLDVNAPEVTAEATGSGNIILSGTTRRFDVEINGSGELHGYNLLSETTKVDIAGSGNAEVYASKQLDISISGSGDVAYKGMPTINQHIAGSGSVRSTP